MFKYETRAILYDFSARTSGSTALGVFTGAISKYHDSTSRQRVTYLKPFLLLLLCVVCCVVVVARVQARIRKESFFLEKMVFETSQLDC